MTIPQELLPVSHIYVDAAKLVAEPQASADDFGKHESLSKARDMAQSITRDCGSTNAALKVSSNASIASLTLTQINTTLAELAGSPTVCLANATVNCLATMPASRIGESGCQSR